MEELDSRKLGGNETCLELSFALASASFVEPVEGKDSSWLIIELMDVPSTLRLCSNSRNDQHVCITRLVGPSKRNDR